MFFENDSAKTDHCVKNTGVGVPQKTDHANRDDLFYTIKIIQLKVKNWDEKKNGKKILKIKKNGAQARAEIFANNAIVIGEEIVPNLCKHFKR